jgi:hypothetical protein
MHDQLNKTILSESKLHSKGLKRFGQTTKCQDYLFY